MTTKHTCNNGNGPVFGRKTTGCPRCDELLSGASPVSWGGSKSYRAQLNRQYTHTCSAKCGPVCTADQW